MKGRKASALEERYMNRITELGCIVCRNNGFNDTPAAIHHISGKTKEGAHFNVLPLCGIHHQTGGYGVAIHQGRVEWEKINGTQQELKKQVDILLNDNY